MNIGILGGSGEVGRHAAARLLARTGHTILLGGRSPAGLVAVQSILGERARAMRTDIFDPQSLAAFCRACDLVINAAGPSALIFDRVAQAALAAGIHAVDPSGNVRLYATLAANSEELRRKGLTCILYAGLSPGISAAYPLHLGKSLFDTVTMLDFYHAGGGKTTFNSAYDFVAAMNDGSSEGMMFWRNGRKERWKTAVKTHCLPHPVGRVEPYPVLSHEFICVAKALAAETARAFNAYTGKETLAALFSIQAFRQATTHARLAKAARVFMEAANRDMEHRTPCFMLHTCLQGMRGKIARRVISTLSVGDAYQVIGNVLAYCAEKTLAGESRPGCLLLHEAVDAAGLMELLEQLGILPETAVEDELPAPREEGEL